MNIEEIEKSFLKYIDTHKGISTKFGEMELNKSDRIGQGGNGLVYLGKINRKDVAVKFLIPNSKKKITRFKSKFFNVNYVRNELINIVNIIHYDELKISNAIVIPYIIMPKYSKNLKKYKNEKNTIEEKNFERLKDFLFSTLDSIHKKGIIHRDIKPENILVDENKKFFLTDFGIAHFDNENYPIDNKTQKGERLANIEFSAPEQINNQCDVTSAADIYSMVQVMY